MKPRRLALFAALGLALAGCGGSSGSNIGAPIGRGTLVNYQKLEDFGTVNMDTVLDYIEYQSGISLSVTSDVTLYKVTYSTVDASGNTVNATGAVAIPDTPTNPALVSYQHSTATKRSNVPSGNNDEGWAVLAIYAATGNYVVSMPDYLGLGDMTTLHPYMHAATEASAALDMIRAARTLCAKLNVSLSPKLYLNGYSQGGHATMALTKLIQDMGSAEFTVTASAPCAGPYDLSGTELPFAFSNPSVDTPLFMSYVTLAYNLVYGLFPNLNQAFITPWDTRTPNLFNGQFDLDDISSALPSELDQLFTAAYIQGVTTDPNNPLVLKLAENDLWEWRPSTKMHLYHASSDEVVQYKNSTVAYNYMLGQGADITLTDLGTGISHEEGFYYAVPMARLWFDSLP
jgi:hypothetical protein